MDDLDINLEDQRRVMATIVFSDAVGFSAQMATDEERTLRLVARDLQLMRRICEEKMGRVLKSTGDGLLMYFDDPFNAVACALKIQQELADQAKNLADTDILAHRIGVHLGNVYLQDNDVMGNGVNIAARLQTQAEPGGICLSKTIYDHIKKTLDIKVTYLGLRELKNISEAFPVYQILLDSARESSQRRSPSVPPRQDYRNRQVLLDKVSRYWIQGVLETSLQGRVALELGLDIREDLLNSPWGLVWQSEDGQNALPPGTQAIDQFDALGSCRSLLILGDPGSGKTTTFLTIARELIERAKYDVSLAIPVVFNLSSWPGKRETIAQWLVTELKSKYQVRQETATTWIQEQKLLLLLDGLDEVEFSRRDACVAALNQFCENHGETELIVCSRIGDYQALQNRLQFQGAICLQPLTTEQVRKYFANGGERLKAIATSMEQDQILQELGRSPLMLSIMSLAYEGMPASELEEQSSLDERRQHLFNRYIQRMLSRRVGSKPYEDEQTKRWLSYLAQQLVKESQTVFLIENIQPSWLTTFAQKLEYNLKLNGIIGMVFGAIASSIFPYIWEMQPNFSVVVYSIIGGLMVGLIAGLWGTVVDYLGGQRINTTTKTLISSALAGLMILIFSGVFNWGYNALMPPEAQGELAIGRWENAPFSYAIYTSIVFALWVISQSPIVPSNQLQWSWLGARRKLVDGMLWGLGIGVVLGGITVSITIAQMSDFLDGSSYILFWTLFLFLGVPLGLAGQVLGGLIGLLIGGFTGVDVDRTIKPNQGIHQALQNGLILGVSIVILFGTPMGLLGSLIGSWAAPMIMGMALGVTISFLSGGLTVLKHLLLRVQLRSLGCMPWNYAHFLDHGTSSIFLQKMGGGYIFVHRLLLEYFASFADVS
ncbi:MAG: NACHT domain-containing protein [Spirulina sp. DLM2.Bin59]|nr:MAG: NACHT domain-containing protein [Spirulina sp. DLM2.Bin59]